MKNKIILLLLLLFSSSLFYMCGNADTQKANRSISVYDENMTLHNMNYDEESSIYNMDYQKRLYDEIAQLKKNEKFTIENPLVIINPFGTNTTGIYIYTLRQM